MKNTWTVALRDLRSYFTSPIGYVFIAGFMLIMGWMFFNQLSMFNLQNMQSQQFNMGKSVSITEGIVRPIFGNMNVILLLMVPFITMGLFAAEKRNHTIELLLTSPISLGELVMGKFVAALLFLVIMLACTLTYPIILFATANPDPGPIFTSYLGTILMTSCYLAFGLLFSAMTENQIVAVAMTFAFVMFFWLVSWASQTAGPFWGDLANQLSLITHYNPLSQGLVSSADLIYFLSFAGVGLFLTYRVLDSYRWR